MPDSLADVGTLALIALVPFVLLVVTCFAKISVVLSLLRNAIGATDAPSGLVIMGLSFLLTLFVMAPVAGDMARAASAAAPTAPGPPPAPRDDSGDLDAAVRSLIPVAMHDRLDTVERASEPLRQFLAKHASPADRTTFVGLAARSGRTVRGDELWVLAPAFVTTELREAFAIAVLVFLPFLVIDLVVGLGLAALGLGATSPQLVALPLKLALFVAVDGWRLLVESLLRGYA